MLTTHRNQVGRPGAVFMLFVLAALSPHQPAACEQTGKLSPICPQVLTQLVPQLIFQTPPEALARVEIRICKFYTAGNLQIVAWRGNATRPSLVVDTDDHTISQLAMSSNVFVIQTARTAYETVFVVNFESGEPKLVLRETTRDAALTRLNDENVTVTVTPLRGKPVTHEYHLQPTITTDGSNK